MQIFLEQFADSMYLMIHYIHYILWRGLSQECYIGIFEKVLKYPMKFIKFIINSLNQILISF